MTDTPEQETVLIVEDDLPTLSLLAELLRGNRYTVLTATCREEALAALALNSINIILLDYMMPGMSAVKFLERISWTHPDTRVVLLTAGDNIQSVSRMLGVREYVPKPIQPDELLQVLSGSRSSRHTCQQ
jgi:CheY-like chemotaxis protein